MIEFFQAVAAAFDGQNLLGYFLRIAVATLCGVAIGLERTKRSKEAGVRTHCIIACASALIMVISKYGFADMVDAAGNALAGTRGVDPSRIAAQVVSGISFLGAGVIFKNGNTVKGLTTAAGIWATAGVGLACGAGMYSVAVIVTALIIMVQLLMHKFSIGNDAYFNGEIRITMVDTPEIRAALKAKQKELGITVTNTRITASDDNTLSLVLQVRLKQDIPFKEIMRFMDQHPEIKSLSV
ncbi:MAG: MgtC/SapB family protein [Clostridia bacterium]|nr:MgtC/SapB family protein [Clostridia bacterium]